MELKELIGWRLGYSHVHQSHIYLFKPHTVFYPYQSRFFKYIQLSSNIDHNVVYK